MTWEGWVLAGIGAILALVVLVLVYFANMMKDNQ